MKIVLTTLIATIFTMSLTANSTPEDERLCKVFKEKAATYKKTMRDDAYALKTLEGYKKRSELFCSK